MGCFDTLDVETECTKCGHMLRGIDTKRFDCGMKTINAGDDTRPYNRLGIPLKPYDLFYCSYDCQACGMTNEMVGIIRDGIFVNVTTADGLDPGMVEGLKNDVYESNRLVYDRENGR